MIRLVVGATLAGMRIAVITTVMVAAIAACTGAAPASPLTATASPTAPSSPSPSAAATTASGPRPIFPGSVTPGAYATSAFRPTLTFTLGDGWDALFADDEDEVAFEHETGAIFFMTRVSQVVDPATSRSIAAPDDLVAWIAKHPDLGADAPKPVEVAGLKGRSVMVHTGTTEIETFAYTTGNMRVPPNFTGRYYVLTMDGPDLTIIVGSPTSGWDKANTLVEPILASLQTSPAA